MMCVCVQVWFQNTRARERKGQYRAHQQLIHKRCPFCKALFRARTALEAHLATKHPDEMACTDVNVDAIPDELMDAVPSSPLLPAAGAAMPQAPPTLNGPSFGGLAAGAGLAPLVAAAGQVRAAAAGPPSDVVLQANMQRLYEDSFRRYIDELSHASHQVIPPPLPLQVLYGNTVIIESYRIRYDTIRDAILTCARKPT